MTMCTVKEIQEAIREDCKSQHDMESTDIDRVMQTLPFAQEEPFTEARPQKPLFWFYARKFEFFQAEDGIRDDLVTGVQTCALPI